jgi:hypothetical protein
MTQDWNDQEYYYDEYTDGDSGRSWSSMALILSGLVGVLIGFACAACLGGLGLAFLLIPTSSTSTANTANPVPAATLVVLPAPTFTPQPQNLPPPGNQPFVSGGLGLSQQEWEQRYGPGSQSETPGYLWYQGTYLVAYQEGNVAYIEQRWNPENAATVDNTRAQSSGLMPADGRYVQTFSPEGRPELVADLYFSQTLISRFSGNVWVGGQPGNFAVTYTISENGVIRSVITLGNNPS